LIESLALFLYLFLKIKISEDKNRIYGFADEYCILSVKKVKQMWNFLCWNSLFFNCIFTTSVEVHSLK